MNGSRAFGGYRWSYFSSLTIEPLRSRVQEFIRLTNWDALLEYSMGARQGVQCKLLPETGLGYNHVVRIIEFSDGVRWVARLRIPSSAEHRLRPNSSKAILTNEYNTMVLVKQRTKIPVPDIHAIAFDPQPSVNAQFMLMDCLEGNAGIDLGMDIPDCRKAHVLAKMAETQLALSTVQLPKIGTIIRKNSDGSFEQGPIPGIGGPFTTATEFFREWAAKVEFGLCQEGLRKAAGSLADELSLSAATFISMIKSSAGSLSSRDKGPFPLCHGDFGHNNMIFDDNYDLLGVIDWEAAFAGPWEIFGEFPLTLSVIPPAMDVPWDYDEKGLPKDAEIIRKYDDRQSYIRAVLDKEKETGLGEEYCLSTALQDTRRQYLVTAMRLYQRGKPGWYSKVTDDFLAGSAS